MSAQIRALFVMTYSHHVTGQTGEVMAAAYLRQQGYEVIATNVASRWAEIDIIAKRAAVYYFFEVKTRRSERYGHPFAAVSRAKLRKIRNLAWLYVQRHHCTYRSLQLGVVGIVLQPGKAPRIDCVNAIDLLL